MVHWHIKPYHVVFLEASSQLRDFLLIQLFYMARRKFHPLIKPETSCQYEWNIGRPLYFGQCNDTTENYSNDVIDLYFRYAMQL